MNAPTSPTRTRQRDVLAVGPDQINVIVPSEHTDGEVAVFEVTLPPGGGPPMLHRHDPFEVYRVRSGELSIYMEDADGAITRVLAGPGAVVPIGAGVEHTVRNESEHDVEATVIFSPGAPMEQFARAAARLAHDEPPSHEAIVALAEAHGIHMTRHLREAFSAERRSAASAVPDGGYLTLTSIAGDGDELLEKYRTFSGVMSGVGRDHRLLLHAGAKTPEGFLIVNLWPSRAESEAAARDPRRLAALTHAGLDPNQIRREHHDVAHFEIP